MTRSTKNLREEMLNEREDEPFRYIRHLEEVNHHLEHDLQNCRSQMESLTSQAQEALETKDHVEEINRKLTMLNRELLENLTECKDDLLRLQPPDQMSDTEVAEHYVTLHQHIARWVDEEVDKSQELESRFEALPWKCDKLPERLREYLTDEILRLAKNHLNAQPLILRHIINSFLETHLLRKDVGLFGLGSFAAAVVRGIERGMKLLQPTRDPVTIRIWRSETLKAIYETDNFREVQQRDKALAYCRSLYQTISWLLPDLEDRTEGWKSLYEQIFVPALQVSNSIKLSTVDYRIATRLPKRADISKPVFYHDLQKCEMIDMVSHKMIRPDSILKIAEDGRIGEQMLCVQPALLKAKHDAEYIVLCKPVFLVKLDEPMAKRSRVNKGLANWLRGLHGE